MYEIEQLVQLARRENNLERSYLYVNPLQGKHIPVAPDKIKEMCKLLADQINNRYKKEKIFIVGFAETATAISAYVASFLRQVIYYENTTREELNDAEYLYFTESHSHATDQKLNVKGFEDYLFMVDRIVFVEDEVTTGNTICKLIDEIKSKFPMQKIKYSMASVLNSMSDERVEELQESGIDCIWLKKIPFEYRVEYIDEFINSEVCMYDYPERSPSISSNIIQVNNAINSRFMCKITEYVRGVNQLCRIIYEKEFSNINFEKVLVIGTEEFMYPAIELAGYLQRKSKYTIVKTHSTTRSPIMAYQANDYPLKVRYKLRSVYDDNRVTYIYNLEKYNKVIIVTDSKLTSKKGLEDLIYVLETVGNDDISVYQWGV